MQKRAIIFKPDDMVAVVLDDVEKGDEVIVEGSLNLEITAIERVPYGHKVAIVKIDKGMKVKKYGEIIGIASLPIIQGEHVHVKNLESLRGRGDRK